MKFEANWKFKSLDSLEKTSWGNTPDESYLMTTVQRLRSLPLNEFEIEDLRIMIGQNIGLQFLIPLAIEQLKNNLLAEGDYYEGDLLQMVLTTDENYWISNRDNWQTVKSIIEDQLETLDANKIKFDQFLNIFESANGK